GKLLVEASGDGRTWVPVGELAEKTTRRFNLPSALFPAAAVWVRLTGEGQERTGEDSHPGNFQVHGYTYEAELEGNPPLAAGRTLYLTIERETSVARVTPLTLGDLLPGTDSRVRLQVANPGPRVLRVQAALTAATQGGKPAVFRQQAQVPAGGQTILEIPYALRGTGSMSATLSVKSGRETLFSASTEFEVPILYAADFGYLLSSGPDADLWWCEGTYKVSQERPAPTTRGPEVRLSAARHEYEPFQVVLRPRRPLKGVTVQADDLVGPGGARIEASHVRLCRVAYVNVTHPTDRVGTVGAWPDPLPPLNGPFNAAAGRNEPVWATVYVPPGTPPGDYTGRLHFRAGEWSRQVPIRLHVWAFTLPKETHVQSAFGLSLGTVRRYHNLSTDADLSRVADLYYQNFAAHRISPYNPMELAPIRVKWGDQLAWNGGRQVTDQPYEGTRCLLVADQDAKATVAATTAERIAVDPAREYQLSWAARTAEEGQPYLVSVQHYNAEGTWLSGRNIDLPGKGTRAWKRETFSLKGRIPPEARWITVTLRPAPWTEDGSSTGTAWFDAVSLRAVPDGPELIADGGFEAVLDPTKVTLDFTDFDRAAEKAFNEYRFTSFRLPLQGMGGGTFHDRHYG
ncbi:MAG: hypothetical protein QHJ73_16050, partial [Armatimonadota bacterium]|nr:hypothetical protein [Armatimonadota bacterium]